MDAIYKPKGKAAEYAKYAVNFYVGCSNDCDYCYCKKGLLGHAMGKPTPTLKKCFTNMDQAVGRFIYEATKILDELREHGLFFSFTTDPLLPETQAATNMAVAWAVKHGIPCKILTKRADFFIPKEFYQYKHLIAYGFTLTGMDGMELHASPNFERIVTMRWLHKAGFKTFASIEPIIEPFRSRDMIIETLDCCDLYKIGLLTGHKEYLPADIAYFVRYINNVVYEYNFSNQRDIKIYWKDSVLEFLKIDQAYRDIDPRYSWKFNLPHCVNANYNMFK